MTVNDLRQQRRMALNGWLAGSADGSPRWEGDDGRRLMLDEYAFWPQEIQAAEQTKFEELDAVYEAAKAKLS